MPDEAGRTRQMLEAIARDKYRLFGDVSDDDYADAWAERLVATVPVAVAEDEYHRRLQSARRAAAALTAARAGEEPPTVDPQDERNFDEFVQTLPDIESPESLGPDRALELLEARVRRLRGLGEAQPLGGLPGGERSALVFFAVLGLPLGCAFIVGFLILFLLFVGVLTLIGLSESVMAGQIALVAALVGAAALVVVVYRKLIVRLPWLRRLVNR